MSSLDHSMTVQVVKVVLSLVDSDRLASTRVDGHIAFVSSIERDTVVVVGSLLRELGNERHEVGTVLVLFKASEPSSVVLRFTDNCGCLKLSVF